jgi:hypothetical protein
VAGLLSMAKTAVSSAKVADVVLMKLGGRLIVSKKSVTLHSEEFINTTLPFKVTYINCPDEHDEPNAYLESCKTKDISQRNSKSHLI